MSTITKISSNQEEAYSYASEERKLEMRRRMQLQARGKASLSLSSLEELAHQQNAGTYTKSNRYRNNGYLRDLDDYADGKNKPIDQPTDYVDGRILLQVSVLPTKAEDKYDYRNPKKAENFVFDNTKKRSEKLFGNQPLNSGLNCVSKTSLMGGMVTDEDIVPLPTRRNIRKDSGVAKIETQSEFNRRLNDIFEKIKKFSSEVELRDHEKEEAFSMVSNLLVKNSGIPFSKDDMAKARGKIRFLQAYVEGLSVGGAYRNEMLAGLKNNFQNEESTSQCQTLQIFSDQIIFEEKLEVEPAGNKEKSKNKPVESPGKDLDTIYLYLETITSALAAPTLPLMFERFSKVLKYKPDQAIHTLAVTGAGLDTIELMAREAERRLSNLSEKMEALSKKNTQSSSFKIAIVEEREKLKSALSNFETLSSRRMDRQFLEKEQERHQAETTLPSVIAKAG